MDELREAIEKHLKKLITSPDPHKREQAVLEAIAAKARRKGGGANEEGGE